MRLGARKCEAEGRGLERLIPCGAAVCKSRIALEQGVDSPRLVKAVQSRLYRGLYQAFSAGRCAASPYTFPMIVDNLRLHAALFDVNRLRPHEDRGHCAAQGCRECQDADLAETLREKLDSGEIECPGCKHDDESSRWRCETE